MNAYRLCIIVLSLVILFSLSGCTKKAEEPEKQEPAKPVLSEKATEPAKDSAAYTAPKSGEGELEIMADLARFTDVWRAQPTDFLALSKAYQSNLAQYVKNTDEKHGTTLNDEIEKALKEGAEGKDIGANRQVVQKGMQMAFIMQFLYGIDSIIGGNTGDDVIGLVQEAAPVMKMIAERRDGSLERGTEFQDAFTAISQKLLSAAKSGDKAGAKASAEELKAFSMKMVLLSVLYEVNGLEQARGKDKDTIATKFEESRYYYRSLKNEHKKRNAEGAATIEGMFTKPPEEVDTDLIQKILAADFKSELAGLDPAKLGM